MNPERVNRVVCMAGYIPMKGFKFDFLILKALMVFFPEILNPNEKNTIKLFGKLCTPNSNMLFKNKEIVNHWLVLLKHSKPQKQKITKYDYKVFSAFEKRPYF